MSTEQRSSISTRYRHAWLLTSLILVVFVRPFLTSWRFGVVLLEVLFLLTLLAGANATAPKKTARTLLGLFLIGSGITRGIWLSIHGNFVLCCFLATYLAYCAIIARLLLRSLFREQKRITADTLYGATSVYLLLGLIWAMAFSILEIASPGSFQAGSSVITEENCLDHLMGFSFTTLTTLGYGNVFPATPKANALANLEAIVGQLYVAIVIARLVALEMGQINDEQKSKEIQTENPDSDA